jgi:hypothetical protein
VVEQLAGDDMAAPHQADAFGGVDAGDVADHIHHPGAAGVDQRPGKMGFGPWGPWVVICQRSPCRSAAMTRVRVRIMRAPLGGVAGVQRDKARILDPAIGIFEGLVELGLQRPPGGVRGQVERAGRGQDLRPPIVSYR